jgi:cellulose synthase/poly-beta-1,6-N-acetylglucosamine synthase-like glycosyltransferase
VPAHNEAVLLPDCLAALRRAAANSPVPVEVIVVADACDDATADVVGAPRGRQYRESVITVRFRNVGAARRSGVETALRDGRDGLWVATTDADTLVHPDWICHQIAHAEHGADLVLGTVKARDWTAWTPAIAAEYQRRYESKLSATGHAHVHGANLGVAAAMYQRVGGFRALASSEDVALVQEVRAAGGRVVTALDIPVLTSTRPDHRAPAGFGDHLHRLRAAVGLADRDGT